MTQTTSLPGHLITIRLYNQPLAQALLDAGIAVEPDTSGVRFACRADPKGTIEVRYGWEEAKELTGYGLAEALADLTPADKREALAAILAQEDVKAGYKGSQLKEIYYEFPGTEGFVTTWLDGDTVMKEERCDDEGEILSLVTDGHLTELRWEHIPPQTRVICQGAAMSCDGIREVRLEHLESVEQGAFQRCDNLERVVIGSDVGEIAEGAFPQCSGLWDVDVSENTNPALAAVNAQYLRGQADEIRRDGEWEYQPLADGSAKLLGSRREEHVVLAIPETVEGRPVTEIAEEAFRNKRFEQVVVPQSVKQLGDGCFYSPHVKRAALFGEAEPDVEGPFSLEVGCCAVKLIEILPGTRRIADCLCENLFGVEEVVLPEGLEVIGDQSFSGCVNLKKINFTEGLRVIEDDAFWDCDLLEELYLPASLESIGSDAFGDCDSLRVVHLPQGCDVDENAFDGCADELELIYDVKVPDTVATRLLRYGKLPTRSAEGAAVCPSTPGQWELAKLLVEELKELGVEDAMVDEHCYVYGHLAATEGMEERPALGFIAHMDTADYPAEGVKPQVIRDYDGGAVTLGDSGKTLTPEQFPHLVELKGRTLITTSGDTLLGADDKAGVAELMTLVERVQELPHGKLCIAFTPDEEIGAGADRFDLERFGAQYAYTVDGGKEGEIQYENFNAASATITIHGLDVHPGEGKNTMVNALLVAMEFNTMLPAAQTPMDTEGYEGFYHLTQMTGNVGQAELHYILRDHSAAGFQVRKETVLHAAKVLNERYGAGTVEWSIQDQYQNMAEVIQQHFHLIDHAKAAAEAVGLTPVVEPIRGGTDGARLSFMGRPCPNLGTGGYAFHGPYEHITVEGMEKTVELLCQLVQK